MAEQDQNRRFFERQPNPALAGLVTGIYGYRGGMAGAESLVEPARLVVALIFNFGSPYRIALGRRPQRAETWRSFVGGLHFGPVWIESGEGAECVQVNLTPLGARRLLRPPAQEFSSRLVALDELADASLSEFARRLADLGDFERRLAATERFLSARLLRLKNQEDAGAAWALSRIIALRGDVRIGAIGESLGWSRRRLAETFTREFGLGPKAIARMARFESALNLARRSAAPDWARSRSRPATRTSRI